MEENFRASLRLYTQLEQAVAACMEPTGWLDEMGKVLIKAKCDGDAVSESIDQYRERKMTFKLAQRIMVRLAGNKERLKIMPISATYNVGDAVETVPVRTIVLEQENEEVYLQCMPLLGMFAGASVRTGRGVRLNQMLFLSKNHKKAVMREELLGMHFLCTLVLKEGRLYVDKFDITKDMEHFNSEVRSVRRCKPSTHDFKCSARKVLGSCFRCPRRQLPLEDETQFGCRYAIH